MIHTRTLALALASLFATTGLRAADPPKKPAPAKPAPKKPAAKKPLPPIKPSVTVKDLAIAEAKKFDTDHNGKISGTEVMAINAEMKSNANSRLYLFDDNSNHYLEESELAKVPLKPAAAKATPKPAAKPKSSASHPHGAKKTN